MCKRVAHWVDTAPLIQSRKDVLGAICSFYRPQSNGCWPSLTTIAKKSGRPRRTVIRIIRWLEDEGYLSIEERFKPNGHQSSHFYRLVGFVPDVDDGIECGHAHGCGCEDLIRINVRPDDVMSDAMKTHQLQLCLGDKNDLDQKMSPTVEASTYQLRTSNIYPPPPPHKRGGGVNSRKHVGVQMKKGATNGPITGTLAEPFLRFWAAYPRRAGQNPKGPAFKKFCLSVKNGADPEDIIRGAELYRLEQLELGHVGTEFICLATTFLNQYRWMDMVEAENEEREELIRRMVE